MAVVKELVKEFSSGCLREAVRLALEGGGEGLAVAKVLISAVIAQTQRSKVDTEGGEGTGIEDIKRLLE